MRLSQVPTSVLEAPEGVIDGKNTTFILSNTPIEETLDLQINGIGQNPLGSSPDFTIKGKTITMKVAPEGSDWILARYSYNQPIVQDR
jgi:hypothetical protein